MRHTLENIFSKMEARQIFSCRGSFTLVELLVVVAIISILAALLLPALQQAREKAWWGLCLHNEKQIGLAMQMYVNDWGRLPTLRDDVSPGFYDWSDLINPYLGGEFSVDSVVTNEVFDCIVYERRSQVTDERPIYSMNWGCQAYVVGDTAGIGDSFARISAPSRRVVIGCLVMNADGSGFDNGMGHWDTKIASSNFHNEGRNFLFADGHAKWVHGDDIPVDNVVGDNRAFWGERTEED